MAIDLIDILRIANDQMVEHRVVIDWMGLMQRLGATPPEDHQRMTRRWALTRQRVSGLLLPLTIRLAQAGWEVACVSATSTVSAGAFWRLDRTRNGSAKAEIPAPIR